MTKIVKVQVPLSTNAPEPLALIYGAGRRNIQQVPVVELPSHVQAVMATRPKAFFLAHWRGRHGWALGERTGDQAW